MHSTSSLVITLLATCVTAVPAVHAQPQTMTSGTLRQLNVAAAQKAENEQIRASVLLNTARRDVAPGDTNLDAAINRALQDVTDIAVAKATDILRSLTPEDRQNLAGQLDAKAQTYETLLTSAQRRNVPLSTATYSYAVTERDKASAAATAVRQTEDDKAPPLDLPTAESIISNTRLAYLICGNRVIDRDRIVYWQKDIDHFTKHYHAVFQSVGRLGYYSLVESGGASYRLQKDEVPFATAFAVDKNLIMTNAHVLPTFAEDVNGEWVIRKDRHVWVNFTAEYKGCPQRQALSYRISRIVAVNGKMDAAILETTSPVQVPTVTIASDTSHALGDAVVVIGYPVEDPNVPRADFAEVYRAPNGLPEDKIKRFLPGVVFVSGYSLAAHDPQRDLEHDASTLNGSSGSPIFRLSDGKMIGLHHNGRFRQTNIATRAALLQPWLDETLRKLQQTASTR